MIKSNTISATCTIHCVFKICAMKTLGSRIAHYRKKVGLSQKELATACGWGSQSRVGNYEKDTREPSLEDIAVIAKALGITSEDLIFRTEHGNTQVTQQPYREPRGYPVISWVAAGTWADSCENPPLEEAEDWLDSSEMAGPCGYWLEIDGESMVSPAGFSFPPGTRILIQPEGFDLISGKLYVAKLLTTGETTFKQYARDAGIEYLRPLNPSFRTLEVDENVRIIGRVVDAKPPKSFL